MRHIEAIPFGLYSEQFLQAVTLPRNNMRVRKMREEADSGCLGQKKQSDFKPSVYPASAPFFEPQDILQVQRDQPKFSDLVELFIVHNGIESTHMMLRGEMGARVDMKNSALVHDYDALQVATGHIFERLAYHWLQIHNDQGLLIDPASSNRIFTRLTKRQEVPYRPDGAHITFSKKHPMIDTIYEYKAHPEANPESTEYSINNMGRFLKHNRGNFFRFSPRLVIDDTKGIESERLTISNSLRANLVVPSDRTIEVPSGIDVIKTPFDSFFLSSVVHAVLSDISNDHD